MERGEIDLGGWATNPLVVCPTETGQGANGPLSPLISCQFSEALWPVPETRALRHLLASRPPSGSEKAGTMTIPRNRQTIEINGWVTFMSGLPPPPAKARPEWEIHSRCWTAAGVRSLANPIPLAGEAVRGFQYHLHQSGSRGL